MIFLRFIIYEIILGKLLNILFNYIIFIYQILIEQSVEQEAIYPFPRFNKAVISEI